MKQGIKAKKSKGNITLIVNNRSIIKVRFGSRTERRKVIKRWWDSFNLEEKEVVYKIELDENCLT